MFLEVPGGKLIAKAKSTRDALYIKYPPSCTYQHMPIYEAHWSLRGRSILSFTSRILALAGRDELAADFGHDGKADGTTSGSRSFERRRACQDARSERGVSGGEW